MLEVARDAAKGMLLLIVLTVACWFIGWIAVLVVPGLVLGKEGSALAIAWYAAVGFCVAGVGFVFFGFCAVLGSLISWFRRTK